ncbi:hypothetical protein C0J52_26203 [Blattella germanica]|nr:hypothetical protein C0J52_26203 [Blattella germanica]
MASLKEILTVQPENFLSALKFIVENELATGDIKADLVQPLSRWLGKIKNLISDYHQFVDLVNKKQSTNADQKKCFPEIEARRTLLDRSNAPNESTVRVLERLQCSLFLRISSLASEQIDSLGALLRSKSVRRAFEQLEHNTHHSVFLDRSPTVEDLVYHSTIPIFNWRNNIASAFKQYIRQVLDVFGHSIDVIRFEPLPDRRSDFHVWRNMYYRDRLQRNVSEKQLIYIMKILNMKSLWHVVKLCRPGVNRAQAISSKWFPGERVPRSQCSCEGNSCILIHFLKQRDALNMARDVEEDS